jgi:hypothetical protein
MLMVSLVLSLLTRNKHAYGFFSVEFADKERSCLWFL